jgi:hypothetical protein
MERFADAMQETIREMGKHFVDAVTSLQMPRGGESEAEMDYMDSGGDNMYSDSDGH